MERSYWMSDEGFRSGVSAEARNPPLRVKPQDRTPLARFLSALLGFFILAAAVAGLYGFGCLVLLVPGWYKPGDDFYLLPLNNPFVAGAAALFIILVVVLALAALAPAGSWLFRVLEATGDLLHERITKPKKASTRGDS